MELEFLLCVRDMFNLIEFLFFSFFYFSSINIFFFTLNMILYYFSQIINWQKSLNYIASLSFTPPKHALMFFGPIQMWGDSSLYLSFFLFLYFFIFGCEKDEAHSLHQTHYTGFITLIIFTCLVKLGALNEIYPTELYNNNWQCTPSHIFSLNNNLDK
jgi:hypothetical protein